MARRARIRSADRAPAIELELVDDDVRSIGPTLAVRVASQGFAGADECVIFHEEAWRTFTTELAALGAGRVHLASAAYVEGGEGLELEVSSPAPGGPFRFHATLKRLVLVGEAWSTHRADVALELDAPALRRAVIELRALVPA